MQFEKFNGSRREDWNVGYNLRNALSQQQKDSIIRIRDEGKRALKNTSQATVAGKAIIPKHLKGTESIVKPPRDKEGNRILPSQYPTKENIASIINDEEEEDSASLIDYLAKAHKA